MRRYTARLIGVFESVFGYPVIVAAIRVPIAAAWIETGILHTTLSHRWAQTILRVHTVRAQGTRGVAPGSRGRCECPDPVTAQGSPGRSAA
jgi:hypothetical protein